MKDHVMREMVTDLCKASHQYIMTEQLRDRMVLAIYPLVEENRKLREAVQKALDLARDGAIESLIEALEAVK